MPIYEFACADCDHRFEELVGMANGEEPKATCPKCGSQDTVRLLSVFAVHGAAAPRTAEAGPAPSGGGCCGGACGCGR